MNKILSAVVAVVLCAAPAFAQGSVHQLYVNGQATGGEVAPRSFGNTVYVPLRFVTDYLGGGATWDNKTRTANLQQGTRNMVFVVGSRRATVNGEGRALTAPLRLQRGRVLLPLRDVGNLMGAQVSYNETSGAVFITVPEGSLNPAIRQGRAARDSNRPDTSATNAAQNGSGAVSGSAP
ncbi:MAG: copper amine oxidase N-terminal domain-containing protein [Akkermansiaceae bacterium]|nr:copper amine oxidase N-terminal domain-containing protein [Armatimonadota bacterium]